MSSKLTALPSLSVPTSDDILYIVDAPTGTAVSSKVTVGNLFLNVPANGLAVGTNQLIVTGGNVGVGIIPTVAKLEVAGCGIFANAALLDDNPTLGVKEFRPGKTWSEIYAEAPNNTNHIYMMHNGTSGEIGCDGIMYFHAGAGVNPAYMFEKWISSSGTYVNIALLNANNGAAYFDLFTASGYFEFGVDNSAGSELSGVPNAAVIMSVLNIPLVLGANAIVRLTILGNGKVGVGTLTPSDIFEVGSASHVSSTIKTTGITSYAAWQNIETPTGQFQFGVERPAGGFLAAGSLANSAVLVTITNTAIHLAPNNVVTVTAPPSGSLLIVALAGIGDRPVMVHSDGTLYCV